MSQKTSENKRAIDQLYKRKWFEIRDGFLFAWFVTMFASAFATNPSSLGGFGAGINAGIALQYVLFRKTRRMWECNRRQDHIDIRTMADLVENMSYKTLHQIDKAGLN